MPLSARRKPARRLPPEVLTTDEVNALIAAIHGSTIAAVRNRALIAFLYRTGLRIAEALSVYPKDIDAHRSAVRVLRGKGGRARTVGIDSGGVAMLQPWIERRQQIQLGDRHPLFCTCWGTHLTTAYVRRLLPKLAARAGITKRVHAHGLRHTHASELREEGIDIGIISKQLGHADISTTASYLDHIAPWAVVNRISARSWGL
ncbi:MAG: tyrosine-type recombinase/integrase [Phycisphaerales bacterium]|nr:tyrosine-type recombinase/integrase [Phycisphaerales bacterium]